MNDAAAARFFEIVTKDLQADGKAWTRSTKSYRELATQLTAVLGHGFPTEAVALVASTVTSTEEEGQPIGPSPRSAEQLVDACRHLRINAKSMEVWRLWQTEYGFEADSHLLPIAAICWADAAVLRTLRGYLVGWLDSLSEAEYEMIRDSIVVLGNIPESNLPKCTLLSTDEMQGIAQDDGSLIGLLVFRSRTPTKTLDSLVELIVRSGNVRANHRRVLAMEALNRLLTMRIAKKAQIGWLGDVVEAFSTAIPSATVHNADAWTRTYALGASAADVVVGAPMSFPDRLVEAAEEVRFDKALGTQPSVSHVATADAWFASEIWPVSLGPSGFDSTEG